MPRTTKEAYEGEAGVVDDAKCEGEDEEEAEKTMSDRDTDQKNALKAMTDLSESFCENLPRSVERAMSEVIPSDDPLDGTDFDPIEYINERFPNEDSLGKLDAFAENIRKQIRSLDEEMYESIRVQAVASKQTGKDVLAAKTAIHDLYLKIKDIKGKAEQSEIMVEEICRDIKQLDNAKRNLTTTITALHKLQTWVTGIDQLKLMVKTKNFDAAAHLLGAVTDLSKHFKNYGNVPKVRKLRDAVQDIRLLLKDEVEDRFREIGTLRVSDRGQGVDDLDREAEQSRRTRNMERLAPAARVVDAMGDEMRERIIKHFCDDQMREYEERYGPSRPGFVLGDVERRYMWYRLLARTFKLECEEALPVSWHMSHRIAFRFCEATRDHIAKLLSDDSELTELIKALKWTIGFEKTLVRTFEGGAKDKRKKRKSTIDTEGDSDFSDMSDFSDLSDDDSDREEELIDDEGNVLDPKSVEGIRLKWARQREERERVDTTSSAKQADAIPRLDVRTMDGLISSVFQPYLPKYVEHERNVMSRTMDRLVNIRSPEVQNNIFVSSLQMFSAMKQSMSRCKIVSKSQAFFSLQKEFKLCCDKYANYLKSLLPTINSKGDYVLKDTDARLLAARVVSTATHCTDTIPQLENIIQQDIDRAFAEHVDMDVESENFYDVISLGITVLVSSTIAQLEPMLSAMMGEVNWENFDTVGDQSVYISKMAAVLKRDIPITRQGLGSTYFPGFCDRLASSFLPRFEENIWTCKSVGEMAAQQLLLDTSAAKELMLSIPKLGRDDDSTEETDSRRHSTFVKLVNQYFSKTEMLIKIIGSPNTSLVSSFKMFWPQGTSEDLQKIMYLKGMPSKEQRMILEKNGMVYSDTIRLGSIASPTPTSSVSSSSALSSLSASSGVLGARTKKNMKNTAEALASMFNFRNA